MKRVAPLALLALIALPGVPIAGAADDITPASLLAVERWVTAVRNHTPGQRDAGLEMVSALTFETRREMHSGMAFFLSTLRGKPVSIKTPSEKHLAAVASVARQNPGADAFLKRAAVLHADAAIKRHVEGLDLAEPPRPGARENLASPLLSQGSLFVNRDGEVLGQTPSDWNWPFARSLLILLTPSPAPDPFVAAWYHATTAFMLRRGLYGEAVSHLQHAAIVLPDDARVLFDRACYAEIQGLPRIQVLLSDHDVLAMLAARRRNNTIRTPPGSLVMGIPPEDETNDEAERLFRLALRANPSFVEARVRLGRLLGLRKRYEEAGSELASALAANPTGPVLFYAHLFAGRAAQARGRIADAADHFRAADSLFPGAQSASLARSQVALLESDVPAALDSIRRMDKSSSAVDPWWWYHFGPGRDADELLMDMWSQVAKL